MLGFASTIEIGESEVARYRQASRSVLRESLDLLREDVSFRRRILDAREPAALLRLARRVVPERVEQVVARSVWGGAAAGGPPPGVAEKPVLLLGRETRQLFAARSVASIEKAGRLLGYEPRVGFEEGMRLTEAWARWANLVPASA
jgi:hypothetical protein